jgi:hypothetical protein
VLPRISPGRAAGRLELERFGAGTRPVWTFVEVLEPFARPGDPPAAFLLLLLVGFLAT